MAKFFAPENGLRLSFGDDAITLPPGEATIGEDGSVSVGGQVAGRLKIVRFNDPHSAAR